MKWLFHFLMALVGVGMVTPRLTVRDWFFMVLWVFLFVMAAWKPNALMNGLFGLGALLTGVSIFLSRREAEELAGIAGTATSATSSDGRPPMARPPGGPRA